MSYNFEKRVYTLPYYDSVDTLYEFYDKSGVEDSSNDYNRILTAIDKGAFIISGCRSAFQVNTVEGIKAQLDYMGVKYSEDELNKLDKVNCDKNSGIYRHLLERYNSKATYELEKDLRSMGYGFRASYGGYQENISTEPSKEHSFFVPCIESKTVKEFENDLAKLVTKYIQDSGLIVHPELNNGKPYYMKADKTIDFGFGQKYPKFKTPEDQYFTETKKTNSKPFTFKDSELTTEQIARDLSNTKLLITKANSRLRPLYDKDGWSKPR